MSFGRGDDHAYQVIRAAAMGGSPDDAYRSRLIVVHTTMRSQHRRRFGEKERVAAWALRRGIAANSLADHKWLYGAVDLHLPGRQAVAGTQVDAEMGERSRPGLGLQARLGGVIQR